MLIKICGMKEPGNVKEVAALHPDMLGFIFYKSSPRYAGDLSPRALERLPAAIGKVGVFVNAETGFIENIVRRYRMDTIQLHGEGIGKIKHPKLAGLDLNSRFETAPGMKNIHLLSRFLAELP